ncbi:Flp family type IVb pilin [bacterium]|nr:Flp family type IVb pilin [bacterium]
MMNLRRNRKGQGLTEYVLLVLLIAIVVFGSIKVFGGKVKDGFEKASDKIEEAQSDE